MHAGIEAIDVQRSFGRIHAVRGVTLTADPGRVTGLIGPNGSGKTTLMLMLASLLAPDAGEIRVAGASPVADPAAVRRAIGWMPDALGAWPALTARQTLVYTARLYGIPVADARTRAAALLARVGLDGLADSPARVLSRGQKQRLGLARALVHDPRVLILDEPASGLDPQARIALRVLLRELAAEGRTVLISSHVLVELEELVDDAVYLVAGRSVVAPAGGPRARQWRLRTVDAPDPARVAAVLGADAAAVRAERDGVLVPFDSEADAARGLREVVAAGIPVVEFAPSVGRLEQAVLDLASEGDAQ